MILLIVTVIYVICSVNALAYNFYNNILISGKCGEKFKPITKSRQICLHLEIPESSGLLTGITDDIKTSSYYTNNLIINDAAILLNNTNYIYDTALKCFQGNQSQTFDHLVKIYNAAEAFISSKEVCDRVELMNGLDSLVSNKGTFAFILGGKNTGKSFLLKRLKEKFSNQSILYVNLRGNSDLLLNFVKVLEDTSGKTVVRALFNQISPVIESMAKKQNIDLKLPFGEILKSLGSVNKVPYFLELFLRVIDLFPKKILTVIVDEANLAFDVDKLANAENIKNIPEILQVLVLLTKEDRKVLINTLYYYISWYIRSKISLLLFLLSITFIILCLLSDK